MDAYICACMHVCPEPCLCTCLHCATHAGLLSPFSPLPPNSNVWTRILKCKKYVTNSLPMIAAPILKPACSIKWYSYNLDYKQTGEHTGGKKTQNRSHWAEGFNESITERNGEGGLNNKGITVITCFGNGDAIENFVAFCILVAWFE